jgi:hypothetical protein
MRLQSAISILTAVKSLKPHIQLFSSTTAFHNLTYNFFQQVIRNNLHQLNTTEVSLNLTVVYVLVRPSLYCTNTLLLFINALADDKLCK